MKLDDAARRWRELSEEVISGMAEWRLQHPKATLNEIETELDQRLDRLRARMLEDVALASASADWSQAATEQPPCCPQCGEPLESAGKRQRQLQTRGRQELTIERQYGVCRKCGNGFFPPR